MREFVLCAIERKEGRIRGEKDPLDIPFEVRR